MSTVSESRGASPVVLDRFLQSERFRKAQPFIAAALLMLCFINFPSQPVSTGNEGWSHVVWSAREHGLRFGRDFIHTYGPTTFLFMVYFPAHTPAIRLISDVLCSYAVALGVCLLAWQMNLRWRLLYLVVFVISPATWIGLTMPELMFVYALFCWGLLTPTHRWAVWVLISLAALLALAKVSFLLTGTITVLAVTWNRRSAIPALAYGAAIVALWLLLGQRLFDIFNFLKTWLQVVSGYGAAASMQLDYVIDYRLVLCAGLLAIALLAGVVWKARLPAEFNVWMAALTFCVWKSAFVRSEVLHQQVLFGFVPMCAIVLAATQANTRLPKILAGACAILCGAVLLFVEPGWINQDELLMRRVSDSVHLLAMPSDYGPATRDAVEQQKQKAALPMISQTVGRATVDVFGSDIGYAPLNDLNYTPRPCCQGYVAYTPQLLRMNAEFYRTNAPEYVLFKLAPMDGHFPPIEDSLVLRDVALDYLPVFAEGEFVLMKRRTHETFRLEKLSGGRIASNQPLEIPGSDGPVWCEIKSARHPLRGLIYSEPMLSVRVKRDGMAHTYEAPRSLLSAGFLARPLLLETGDITNNLASAKCELTFAESVEYGFYRLLRR